jgi:hypothetical protein
MRSQARRSRHSILESIRESSCAQVVLFVSRPPTVRNCVLFYSMAIQVVNRNEGGIEEGL